MPKTTVSVQPWGSGCRLQIHVPHSIMRLDFHSSNMGLAAMPHISTSHLVALGLLVSSWGSPLSAADWPQWQGPNRDNVSTETGLLKSWPETGPALAWRIESLGGGDSAPAVSQGRLYGMSTRDGQEIVWCLSEQDGSEIWATSIGDSVEQRMPQSKEGPGGTPTVSGDHLYVIGMGGRIACLSLDGEIVWQRSLVDDFGGMLPAWSYRESPLVDGSLVICTPGSSDALLVALDAKTGETIWKTQGPAEEPPAEPASPEPPRPQLQQRQAQSDQADNPPGERRGPPPGGGRGFGRGRGGPRSGAGYSSVIAVELAGRKQYVQLTAKALVGVDAADGTLLWQYKAPANPMGINCSTPLVHEGLVFAASAYGTGGGAVKLSPTADGGVAAEEAYFSPRMQNHHGGMIVVDGNLYGAHGGNEGGFLTCLDFQTGEVLWRDREGPKGALTMADGMLYLRAEDGELLLIQPTPEKLDVRGRFPQPDRRSPPAWAHPVIANGKLYIRDQDLLLCYDVSASER
jgi:outer membrane protein assembly factor BamB